MRTRVREALTRLVVDSSNVKTCTTGKESCSEAISIQIGELERQNCMVPFPVMVMAGVAARTVLANAANATAERVP